MSAILNAITQAAPLTVALFGLVSAMVWAAITEE